MIFMGEIYFRPLLINMDIYREKISEFSQQEYDNAFSLLSSERQNAVLRMKFENDRKRSVLGEFLARKAISKQFEISQNDIIIKRTENGKPYCENLNIHFSIGHCKDFVVCVVNDSPVGVDIEFIRPLDLRVTRFACTEKDLAFLNSCDENQKELNFFRLWTAKEAFIKFHGKVLADLKTVDYESLIPNCKVLEFDGYIATIYKEE